MSVVRVLSGTQPWWWCVLHLDKHLENRSRPMLGLGFRGDVLLHASQSKGRKVDAENWKSAHAFVRERFGEALAARIPPVGYLPMGGIVGRATVVGVIRPGAVEYPEGFDRRWHMESQYAYLLKDRQATPFVPWSGCQSAIAAPADLLAALTEAQLS